MFDRQPNSDPVYVNLRKVSLAIIAVLLSFRLPAQQVKFFSSDKDLSNSMITCILQDNQGFMWIATEDGLNRFDGLKFLTFRKNSDDPSVITSNFIRTLFVDSKGRLWVGCINGLMLYNSDKQSFEEIRLLKDTVLLNPHVTSIVESAKGKILIATSGQGLVVIKPGERTGHVDINLTNKLSSRFLECIYEDFKGRLWIGTENEGLNFYDPVTNDIKIFRYVPDKQSTISSNYITAICEDDRRNILVGTLNGGLNIYNEGDATFKIIPSSVGHAASLPVQSLFTDKFFNLWVGTNGQGLWKLNLNSRILEPKYITAPRFEVNKSKIHAITEDREGNLWLGIFQKGVLMIPSKTNRFNSYMYQQFGQKSIGSSCVLALAEDNTGQLWIGTDTEGIYKINRQNGQISNFHVKPSKLEVNSGTITSICIEPDGEMWLGTSMEGFMKFDPNTGKGKYYKHQLLESNSLSNDKVQCIMADNENNLWIGTSGGGLNKYNTLSGKFTTFLNNPADEPNSLCNNWINCTFCDSDGLIWIGTYNRLSVYDPSSGKYRMLSTGNGLLPNNIIYNITEASKGKIWIGTNAGLACYDKKTNTSKFFTTEDGLCNNVISAILADENQQLWISTHLGISCYNMKSSKFKNYFVYDGLQGNEFRRNSAFKARNGELFFGGINGVTWFSPDLITDDQNIPEVYLSDLILFNKPVQIGEKIGSRVILEKSIEKTDTLYLSWLQKNFSIEFSTIGFSNPERISFQYQLLGFDIKSINTGTGNRRATYTNLEPGKYTFEVRATDKEAFSKYRKLVVYITPPWWESGLFKFIYFTFTALLLYFIYIFLKSRIKHRHELLVLDHHEKINEAKLQFFTNISHEIRTPLTLITSPLDKLIAENKDATLAKTYQHMSRNTQRLMRLVNQLLDLRKIDRGQLLIHYSEVEIIMFITEIMQAFDHIAEKKQIKYDFRHSMETLKVWIDPNNFDKVLYNVLSNAFKFTPQNGQIEVFLKTGQNPENSKYLKEYAEISVVDTGPGIEEDKLKRIFDRFYQIEDNKNINTGTGIGLHLSQSIVEMQHGIIFAQNRPNSNGSIFIIQIPLGNQHVPAEELTAEHTNTHTPKGDSSFLSFIDSDNGSTEGFVRETKVRVKSRFKILIVDDDTQMRNYLKEEIGQHFSISEAPNGKEALDIVLKNLPDLVVSDIKMPLMDGITLCRRLKSNPSTNHIPVVLLTALSSDEDRAQGIDTGADAYLEKPFNADMLTKIIYNLLGNRERIKIKYSPMGNINTKNKVFTSADEALMNKVLDIIEKRISDPVFNAEALSKEVGMSRVHLFRRLKKITGQAPSEFIRRIRLQEAAHLISGHKGSIKEIAFEVGFNSISHFSQCFHEFYGVKPSEYKHQNNAETDSSEEKGFSAEIDSKKGL